LKRRLFNPLLWIIVCALGIVFLEERALNNTYMSGPAQGVYKTEPDSGSSHPQHYIQTGEVISSDGASRLDTAGLKQIVESAGPRFKNHSFYFNDSHNNIITYAATGLDQSAYFANSYLTGFVPFETDKIWVPLATLSMRKHYMLDHKLYGPGLEDIWQNSEQAYYYSHGDCEDHAVLLADWLIGLGYNARVAIGDTPQGGHAWVILFLNEKEYVLESTTKNRPRSVRDFYLAALATDYRPKLMFDRTHLWVNSGSKYTTRYSGDHWKLRSRFTRSNPNSGLTLSH